MKIQNRRLFLQSFAIGSIGIPLGLDLWGKDKNDPNRFQIGIQEYTFNRLLRSGKLKHLDYPAMVKKELGIEHVEYWSRPFEGKHTDKKFVGELKKRTNGGGISNVLILVDEKHELDDEKKSERDLSVDLHKGWIDCAAQLGCSAIRVNCRKGGDPQDNLSRAVDGVRRLCEYAQDTRVKVVVEPHGRNSQDPDWLLALMKELNHPNAGILPDFNNFGSFNRYSAVEKTLPYAPAVCAKALKFDEKGNETHTDYFKMLRIVHDSDFSGVISIEFEGHGVDPVAGSRMAQELILNALRKARNS